MTTSRTDLPVVVDRSAAEPLAVQISEQVRAVVTAGVLHAGERLPATRDLAAVLGVSRTVVTTAYARLFAEGYLQGRHGSGTYVADVGAGLPPVGNGAATAAAANGPNGARGGALGVAHGADGAVEVAAPGAGTRELIELRPGIPWAAGIEPAVWRRAWRIAGTHPPSFWPDPHGLPELRAELAGYLRRSRGLRTTPQNVLVTRGVSGGLALLAAALVRPGDTVGVEDPGYPAAREVLRGAGALVVPCRIDAHGIVPDELPAGLRLLYTTPAHQYPLGGRLPVGRRQALINWARVTGAVVVEDDYDSEFRYDVGPLPALYSMDPDVIVYLGTASKVLAPAFGAGWLVASPDLVERLARLRPALGERVAEPVQRALLALLTSGDLERHIRRMRLEYARRRAALVGALTGPGGPSHPPTAPRTFRILGDTAGMHVVLQLPDGCDADGFVAAAAARGVAVATLARYYAGRPTRSGLILGYGAAPLTKVRRAAAELRAVLAGEGDGDNELGRDRQRRGRRQRGGQFARIYLQHVRSGKPVDVDRSGAAVVAARNLGRAEVAATGPEHPAALSPRPAPVNASDSGETSAKTRTGTMAPVRGRPPGRPAARHVPRVQPAHDRRGAGQRTAGERVGGMPQHPDLHADPALGVDVVRRGRHLVRSPVEPLRRAERAAGPQDRDELDDLARDRVPDEVTRAALCDQSLSSGLNGHGARGGTQCHPDSPRRTSPQWTPVGSRPDAPCFRHPCVWHKLSPPKYGGLDLTVPDFSHLLTPLAAISPEGKRRIPEGGIWNPEEILAGRCLLRAEYCGGSEARRPAFAGPHNDRRLSSRAGSRDRGQVY